MKRGKGKPFVKGDARAGRPRKPADLKKAATLTRTEAEALLVQFMRMDIKELEAVMRDQSRLVMEHWVARICFIGIKEGDSRRLDFILDRLFGRVASLSPKDANPEALNFRALPRERVIELGKEAIAKLEREKTIDVKLEE